MAHHSDSHRGPIHFHRYLFVAVVMTLAVAACGGNEAESTTTAGDNIATTAVSGATTSQPASDTTLPDTGSGGGEACDMMTAEEVAGVMGVDITTTEPLSGTVSYCAYKDGDGNSVVATSFTTVDAETTYQVWASASGVSTVSGLGDGAVFDPNSATLFILKGGSFIGITAGDGSVDVADRQALAEQLGAIAVDHM